MRQLSAVVADEELPDPAPALPPMKLHSLAVSAIRQVTRWRELGSQHEGGGSDLEWLFTQTAFQLLNQTTALHRPTPDTDTRARRSRSGAERQNLFRLF
eukprot:15446328-Alexandrium_andersonii.AAC.1